MARAADTVPDCFLVASGPFDVEKVESFFAERRAVMLSDADDVEPLIPLHKLPSVVQSRWRQYLREKGERQRPMNGVTMGSGKIAARADVRPATQLLQAVVTENVTEKAAVTGIVTEKAAKKRGRPKKSTVLSPADKQRAYRERKKEQ